VVRKRHETPVDRHAAHLGAAGDGELLAHHVGQRRELDDARGGDLPQVVREQQRGDRVDDLGQLVVELLPDFPGEERDALEQALDVRIAPALGEERRDGRVGRGELLPQLAQVLQLVLVVLVEHRARFAGRAGSTGFRPRGVLSTGSSAASHFRPRGRAATQPRCTAASP
jgi:hypothetical protein